MRRAFPSAHATVGRRRVSSKRDICTARVFIRFAHDHYGMPDAPRFAIRLSASCSRSRSRPCGCSPKLARGGGGYFRLLPYALSRWCIGHVNAVDRQPAIFYFHPWELDPEQPRIAGMRPQDAVPPLREPRSNGRTASVRCCATSAWGRVDEVFLRSQSDVVRRSVARWLSRHNRKSV